MGVPNARAETRGETQVPIVPNDRLRNHTVVDDVIISELKCLLYDVTSTVQPNVVRSERCRMSSTSTSARTGEVFKKDLFCLPYLLLVMGKILFKCS